MNLNMSRGEIIWLQQFAFHEYRKTPKELSIVTITRVLVLVNIL
jgi:hypothetical protein